MIRFEDNEFEIALCTYNRSEFVRKWLDLNYQQAVNRNISIRIIDSSTNEETCDFINNFNKDKTIGVQYLKIDSSTIIGYKPMEALLSATTKYTWVAGDSRYHDYGELDKTVFPCIKRGIDFITLYIVNNAHNSGKVYTDYSEFIHDCFVSTTCIGLSIYKNSIFNDIKNNPASMAQLDNLFSNNYGFAWLGYFYSEFAKGNYTAAFEKVNVYNILSNKKKQTWAKRFYGCWLDDLCQIVDNIPDVYKDKDKIPFEVWRDMKLWGDSHCYTARKHGDLNKDSFNRYLENGALDRITEDYRTIKYYACAPMFMVECRYLLFRILRKLKSLVKKAGVIK